MRKRQEGRRGERTNDLGEKGHGVRDREVADEQRGVEDGKVTDGAVRVVKAFHEQRAELVEHGRFQVIDDSLPTFIRDEEELFQSQQRNLETAITDKRERQKTREKKKKKTSLVGRGKEPKAISTRMTEEAGLFFRDSIRRTEEWCAVSGRIEPSRSSRYWACAISSTKTKTKRKKKGKQNKTQKKRRKRRMSSSSSEASIGRGAVVSSLENWRFSEATKMACFQGAYRTTFVWDGTQIVPEGDPKQFFGYRGLLPSKTPPLK